MLYDSDQSGVGKLYAKESRELVGEFEYAVTITAGRGLRRMSADVSMPWTTAMKLIQDNTLLVLALEGGGFLDMRVSGVTPMDDASVEITPTGGIRADW